MDFEYSDRTKALLEKLNKFMDEVVYPAESVYEEQLNSAKDRWQLPPVLEECKAEAKKRGHDVKIGRFNFGNIAKPRIIGQDFGLVKVVSESKYDEILGIHMVGPHVTDLISEACVALRLESTTEELMRTIHPHPTLPEALMQAAEAVYGHAIDA